MEDVLPATAAAAYQTDRATILVGHHPPAVVLLLADPAVTLEGRMGKRERHGGKRNGYGENRAAVYSTPFSRMLTKSVGEQFVLGAEAGMS